MTDKSKKVLTETQMINPVVESLDPETFEVTAKKHDAIWNNQQYKASEFREDLMQTTDRIAQCQLPEQELLEQMRTKEFNIRVTNIGEFSNAINRGKVFTNPKFSSC